MIRTLAAYGFAAGSPHLAFLGDGWGEATARGTWLASPVAGLTLPPEAASDLAVEISLDPQLQHGVARAATCVIAAGGSQLASRTIHGPVRWTVSLPVSQGAPIRLAVSVNEAEGGHRVLLSAITIVQARPPMLPPPFVKLEEIRFGWNDSGNAWLGEGWGTPEDDYVWAVGPRSILRLPVSPDGSPQIALLDMRPFHRPPAPPRQRVQVHADGSAPVTIELHDRLINAFSLRPLPGQTEILLTFQNLDAAFETSDPFFHFGKPFAWALSSVRIMPALPRFLPAYRPPVPGALANGTLRDAVFARVGVHLPELADCFTVLGNCCEFTNFQRAEGRDRPGLLRLTALRQREMIEGLFTGFYGIGRMEQLSCHDPGPVDDHWRVVDAIHSINFGTPFPKCQPFPNGEMLRQSRRLPRLAEKLIEELSDSDRIFLFRVADPGAGEPAMLAVQAALRRFGPAPVIWLVNDGAAPAGSAERLACGVVRAHLEPLARTPVSAPETVASVMTNALILLRQAQPLPP
jgi:hypothetical protein